MFHQAGASRRSTHRFQRTVFPGPAAGSPHATRAADWIKSERDAILLRAIAKVEVTRQPAGRGGSCVVMIENHGQPRIARSPLPLEPDARWTPFKSNGMVPMVLMQSRHNLVLCVAQRDRSAARSLSTPLEVSQWTHHSQAGPADSFFSTAARSSGPYSGNSRTSNFKLNRWAWSTNRLPNSPLLNTSPGRS